MFHLITLAVGCRFLIQSETNLKNAEYKYWNNFTAYIVLKYFDLNKIWNLTERIYTLRFLMYLDWKYVVNQPSNKS